MAPQIRAASKVQIPPIQVLEALEVIGSDPAADPQPDMRGSAEYKRALVSALVKRAIEIAMRRARGEQVEASHIYA